MKHMEDRLKAETTNIKPETIEEARALRKTCAYFMSDDDGKAPTLDHVYTEPKATKGMKEAEKLGLNEDSFAVKAQDTVPFHLQQHWDYALLPSIRYLKHNGRVEKLQALSVIFKELALYTTAQADIAKQQSVINEQVRKNWTTAEEFISEWEKEQFTLADSKALGVEAVLKALAEGKSEEAKVMLEKHQKQQDAKHYAYERTKDMKYVTPNGVSFDGLQQLV